MATYPMIYSANMTEQQRALYYAELSVVQKDEVLGVLLAVFLGTFGAHHFYLRRTGLGVLYCILSVTGFSTIAGFIEAFFMPERIRRFNAEQAAAIATHLGFYAPAPMGGFGPGPITSGGAVPTYGSVPGPLSVVSGANAPVACHACGAPVAGGVNFCSRCGASLPS